jgi:anti-sigma regulatory factor (Ser/Thr protein kinase)
MRGTRDKAELLLPMSDSSPARARDFTRASECLDHGYPFMDEALLLVTELVTNSIKHGLSPIVLTIERAGPRFSVRDGSPSLPRPRSTSTGCESGRGLGLVDQVSRSWGVDDIDDASGGGKSVWFELR